METEDTLTNIILCGNCITIMNQRLFESVDLIVTSPPYNINVVYDNWDDNQSYWNYLDFCRNWLAQASRLLKPGGYICVNFPGVSRQDTVEGERTSNLMDLYGMLDAASLNFFGNVTWYKARKQYRNKTGERQRKRYLGSTHCDGILIAQKPPTTAPSTAVYDQENEIFMGTHKGLWKITSASETLDKLNPAPWPIEVPYRCIQLLSKEGDVVLDPFNGSGTTCLAAKQLKRLYIGIDISAEYCRGAVVRVAAGKNTSYDDVITDDNFWENVTGKPNTPVKKSSSEVLKHNIYQNESRFKTPRTRFGHPRFYELLEEMAQTHSSKNHDYSAIEDPLSNFKEVAEFADISPYKVVMVNIGMKISRLKNLMLHSPEVKTETVRDTLKDLSVYALLAQIVDEVLGQGNVKKDKTTKTE